MSTTTSTATSSPVAANRNETSFALSASGYGTRLRGGQVPIGSDETAYQSIGCTNLAGRSKENFESRVTVPGLGVLHGVRTEVWTQKRGDTVSSFARHTIARVTLAGNDAGSIELRGIESFAHAFHDGRFRAQTVTDVASAVLTPASGEKQELRVPVPGRPLVVPGLARIKVADSTKTVRSDSSRATSVALDIDVLPTSTRTRVARATAQVAGGIKRGVFSGFSSGLRAEGLDNNLEVGRTPLSLLPCQGTRGERVYREVARVGLGDQATARGLSSSVQASQNRTMATGSDIGRVETVWISDGDRDVEINGVRGRANVVRTAQGVARNAQGTMEGRIFVDGEEREFPRSGVIEVPGVVRIEDRIVRKTSRGVRVVALRLTLLDGSAATVELGIASLAIKPGPLG